MSISVVVPVYNQVHFTERCLNSVLDNSLLARNIIVVDNGSRDSTAEILKEYQKRFSQQGWKFDVITIPDNIGFGRACNRGILASTCEFVAILSNDTWVMEGWDEVLLRRVNCLSADMVGPHYDEGPFDTEETPLKAKKYVARNRNKFSRDWVSMLMFFRRETLDAIGLFDERFYLTYEDTDLRERMDRAGKKYFQVGDCYIWHFSKGTRGENKQSSDYEREGLRLFMEKWGFDPRITEKTFSNKLRRKWKKIKAAMGLF